MASKKLTSASWTTDGSVIRAEQTWTVTNVSGTTSAKLKAAEAFVGVQVGDPHPDNDGERLCYAKTISSRKGIGSDDATVTISYYGGFRTPQFSVGASLRGDNTARDDNGPIKIKYRADGADEVTVGAEVPVTIATHSARFVWVDQENLASLAHTLVNTICDDTFLISGSKHKWKCTALTQEPLDNNKTFLHTVVFEWDDDGHDPIVVYKDSTGRIPDAIEIPGDLEPGQDANGVYRVKFYKQRNFSEQYPGGFGGLLPYRIDGTPLS